MEKRERGLNKILSHSPSQTVGQEGQNQSVLMHFHGGSHWYLHWSDSETLLRHIMQSFSGVFITTDHVTRLSNTVCEQHGSALSPSDALAENGQIHSHVCRSIALL